LEVNTRTEEHLLKPRTICSCVFSGKPRAQLNHESPRGVSVLRTAQHRRPEPILRLLLSSAIRINSQDMDAEQQEQVSHFMVQGRHTEYRVPGSLDMADYG
jgi:hypothetical protein